MSKNKEYMDILVITVFKNDFSQTIRTLDSLQVTERKFNVILKNGGQLLSLEHKNILENYLGNLKIYLYESIDEGIYDAMNQALLFAKSNLLLEKNNWIWFLNSGDVIDRSPIGVINMDLSCYTNAGIKFGQPSYGLQKETRIAHRIDELKFLLGDIRFNHQAVLFHKRIFYELGLFNRRYKITADYNFIHRALKANSFEYIDWLKIGVESGGLSESRATEAEVEKLIYLLSLFCIEKKVHFLSIFRKRAISLGKHMIKNLLSRNVSRITYLIIHGFKR